MSAPHRSLVLILIAFTLLSLAFNTLTPLGEAPDEVSHFSYVRHLAATSRLPEPQGTVFGEVFQPPLYYVLAAPLTTWLAPGSLPVEANSDWLLGDPYRGFNVLIHPAAARWPWRGEALAWHLARLPSTVFGLVTLLATAGIARRTFPDHPWVAVAATAFVGFIPQFAFLSGAVSNDVLATALGALLLWQLARIVTNPQAAGSGGQWALVGALGGLGIWAKASGWTFAATALAAVLL
ncbi:MAG TPA: glycosyltransferase family 39 protein, partial [Ardenticatenaceae bacterium]|nr:glycosyltransferase family 39 protein [Ardenticatenaceae bacterium]